MSAGQNKQPADDISQPIILYYKNLMSSSYNEDAKAIKNIVKRVVESMTPAQKVKLVVYCKTRKTSRHPPRNLRA